MSKLIALDQKYPSELAVKVDLGGYFLMQGDLVKARAYLQRGEELVSLFTDGELKSVLWADLADLELKEGQAKKAVQYADRSLENKDEKLGVVFTRAKANLLLGMQAAALDDFKTGWDTRRNTMTSSEYAVYARTLIDTGDYDKAIEVLEAFRLNMPYEVGTGLMLSVSYEKLLRYDESLLSAFVDVLYQRSRGLIDQTRILANLQNLRAKLSEKNTNPDGQGLVTLAAVGAYFRDDWNAILAPGVAETLTWSDGQYLRLAAALETGKAGDAELQAYAQLEARFHDFPSYYLHLINYFQRSRKDFKNDGFLTMAEKVVNLAPAGYYAAAGRRALALACGLGEDQARNLLTRAEVDFVVQTFLRTAQFSDLGPLFVLLGTPDNPSEAYAVGRLQQLAVNEAVRSLLQNFQKTTSGRLGERLNLALQKN